MPILVIAKGVAEGCVVSSFGLVLLLQSFDMSSDLGSCPHFSLLFYKLHCRSLVTARRNPKRFAKWFGSCSGSGCEKQHDHWAPTFDESVYCCHATESDSLSCAGMSLRSFHAVLIWGRSKTTWKLKVDLSSSAPWKAWTLQSVETTRPPGRTMHPHRTSESVTDESVCVSHSHYPVQPDGLSSLDQDHHNSDTVISDGSSGAGR